MLNPVRPPKGRTFLGDQYRDEYEQEIIKERLKKKQGRRSELKLQKRRVHS